MIINKKFLAGSDPEWFIVNNHEQRFISAEGLLGGTKEKPKPIGDGFFIQEDNCAAEGNIPPASSKEEFVKNISTLKEKIALLLPKNCELYKGSTGVFSLEDVGTEQGMTFGCEPDTNAYTKKLNSPVCPISGDQERFSAAHIHLGYDDPTKTKSFILVKTLDLMAAVPSILLDDDRERRRMYGKAGACRIKDYGVEYRVLSNFWTRSKESIEWAYESMVKAIDFINSGEGIDKQTQKRVIAAVNNYDEKVAYSLVKDFSLL